MMNPTRLRASRPEDLLQLVPYLLGFRPRESLVLVCLRRAEVVCTARVDLAAVADVEDAAALIGRMAASTRLEAMIPIAYSASRNMAVDVLSMVEAASDQHQVIDLLWVDGLAWESLGQGGEGRYDDSGALAAAAVYAGLSAAHDRAAVVALVEPGEQAAKTVAALPAARARAARWGDARRRRELQRLLTEQSSPPAAALLLELLADPALRDRVLLQLDRDAARRALPFWLALAPLLPDHPHAVHALGMLGMHAWLAGEGALTVAALERGRRIGAEAGLLSILETINELALSPEWWAQLREELAA